MSFYRDTQNLPIFVHVSIGLKKIEAHIIQLKDRKNNINLHLKLPYLFKISSLQINHKNFNFHFLSQKNIHNTTLSLQISYSLPFSSY